MIITVTLNPAMDKTTTINNFEINNVNKITDSIYNIAGKGINVSKVLKNFNVDSMCTGFLGGIWEETFKKELKNKNIDFDFINIDGDTRTNIKILDEVNNTFTDINEAGPFISKENINDFFVNFKNMCNENDIVVIAGGVSTSVPKDIYAKLIKIAKEKGAKTILDADDELFVEGIKEKPDIIKPNDIEFGRLMKRKFETKEDIIKAARELIKTGINKILISLGGKGALYITDKKAYYAKGIKVTVKSTVGAGDSMVAALVYSMVNNFSDKETLKFAVGCGTASVTLKGTEACTINQVNELLDKIEVIEI